MITQESAESELALLESSASEQFDLEIKSYHHSRPLGVSLFPSIPKCKIYLYHGLQTILKALTPSFLSPTKDCSAKSLRRTAALDGLRGLAAFIVVNYHFARAFYDIDGGYVSGHPQFQRWYNVPFLKFFTNGTAQVHIFFVISGYILSLRVLQHIQKRNLGGVVTTLSSSTIRRGFRLFGPTTICLVIETIALRLGLYERGRRVMVTFLEWDWNMFPRRKDTFAEQLWTLYYVVWGNANSFDWKDFRPWELDANQWTIGIEFRCSIALFTIALALSRVHRAWPRRMIISLLIGIYTTYQVWDLNLFLAGMLLADIGISWTSMSEPASFHVTPHHHLKWGTITMLGLFFASSPYAAPEASVGFRSLTKLASYVYWAGPWHFCQSVGAILLIPAAMHYSPLNWILTTPIIQYLGKVSYMLYLVHGPLIRGWGFTVVGAIWQLFGLQTPEDAWKYYFGVLAGYVPFMIVAFWLADIYTRHIDQRCIELARSFEKFCTDD